MHLSNHICAPLFNVSAFFSSTLSLQLHFYLQPSASKDNTAQHTRTDRLFAHLPLSFFVTDDKSETIFATIVSNWCHGSLPLIGMQQQPHLHLQKLSVRHRCCEISLLVLLQVN